MKTTKLGMVTAMMLAMGISPALHAGDWELGIQGGTTKALVTPHADTEYESTWIAGASILYSPVSWFAVGPEFGYSAGHTYHVYVWIPPILRLESSRSIYHLVPEFRFGPRIKIGDEGFLQPYVIGGYGAYLTRDVSTLGYWNIQDEQKLHGGFNVGVGLSIKPGEHFVFGPEYRYHQVDEPGEDFKYGSVQLRLGLLF